MTFDEWKTTQDLNGWNGNYNLKTRNAKLVNLQNLLTFEEYLFKAFEAGLQSPDDVGLTKYHLSRINDSGNYTVSNCRFLSSFDNLSEQNKVGEKNGRAKLTNDQVIKNISRLTTL